MPDSSPDAQLIEASDDASRNEATLYARAQAGDEAAWSELLHHMNPKLRRVVRRRLSPTLRTYMDSMDLAGEVWMSLLRDNEKPFDFPDLESLEHYLVKSACHKVTAAYRRFGTKKRRSDRVRSDELALEGVSSGDTPEAIAVAKETREHLHERCTSDQERQMIKFKEDGYSNPEIARMTGLHVRSVQRWLSKLLPS